MLDKCDVKFSPIYLHLIFWIERDSMFLQNNSTYLPNKLHSTTSQTTITLTFTAVGRHTSHYILYLNNINFSFFSEKILQ